MFVCEDCINKFEPVAALATFYKTCEICGERRTCIDLSPNVKRIDSVLELIIEHKDGKFINWSMRDPNDPTRKFGEDDAALIRQVINGLPSGKEPGIHPDILKTARCDGHAHHLTDGQEYLVTFIGVKETPWYAGYEGPDISLEEPQCETGPDNEGNCPYFPSYPTPCQKIRKDRKCPAKDTDPKRWACEECGHDMGEFSRNPTTSYPNYPGNCTECGGHVGYDRSPPGDVGCQLSDTMGVDAGKPYEDSEIVELRRRAPAEEPDKENRLCYTNSCPKWLDDICRNSTGCADCSTRTTEPSPKEPEEGT